MDITTTLLMIIGGIGMWRGLKELGAVEKYAVALNLGMIGALLVALVVYNVKLLIGGDWPLRRLPVNSVLRWLMTRGPVVYLKI